LKETDLVTFLPMEDLGVLNKEIVGVKERQLKEVAGSYTYFADNDVLLAKITPCFENGKIGIARNLINGIGFGSSEYIVFRSRGEIEPSYLYYFLSRTQIREEGRKLMTGAVGHKRVSKEWIENYLIPYPVSLKEQQTIVQKLDALSAQTKKLEAIYQQHLNDLDELKKSILQKAFNGELNTEKSRRDAMIIAMQKAGNPNPEGVK
jgi:type I restriction enzyme, S subunit